MLSYSTILRKWFFTGDMADAISPDVHISRRRKRNSKYEENFEDIDSKYEDEFDEDFVPAKRGRLLKPKPLRNLNSYDSIQLEVTKEKQRKTPMRKPKPTRSTKRDEIEEAEDSEMKMSARMVDRIAALNDGKRTKVVMANCFEDRTALDCIDVCLKESENMQEDAVALAIATAVYSLRVDRTHNDAQETRYTFIRGKSDAEKAMLLATGENIENAKDKRKRKKNENTDTFDYTFGLKFPLSGSFLQHWSFTQELLERVESRRLDVRKKRRKRKLMSWKKIPPLEFCTTYTDFMREDAVALAIATAVYSLRVDRTHNDAQETRYTFIRGKSDAEKDTDTFDYTFGLKFPLSGSFLQHWSFTQELLERVESRRLDVRKKRRKRKLMSWKKIPPLEFCTTYTDFMRVTANLESDRVDALATFQARRDISGKVIILHDAMVRRPVPQSRYCDDIELATVKRCQDMLANALQKEPITWEHFMLEDNPLLYKTGQYLRTGDMTGYVLQERPFYHHFDPEEESCDDPRDRYNCVEKNADKTLYTFKKPPKGTAFGRLAPLIRVPVNKYANPRNRKIEDIYFKEDIEVKHLEDERSKLDLVKLTADARKQLENQKITAADMLLVNFRVSPSTAVESSLADFEGIEESSTVGGGSLIKRLKAEHERQNAVFENLRNELTQTARLRCNSVVKECCDARANLSSDADEEEVDEEDIKEWKTSRFLDLIEPPKEKTFLDTLQNIFSKAFELPRSNDSKSEDRKQMVTSILGAGSDVVEKCGIHTERIKTMGRATYHMKVFKFRVTVEQAHESLR
ncbi:hypothetical protein OSTOST_06054 [Ostertagia ostertagi]